MNRLQLLILSQDFCNAIEKPFGNLLPVIVYVCAEVIFNQLVAARLTIFTNSDLSFEAPSSFFPQSWFISDFLTNTPTMNCSHKAKM